MVFHFDIIYFIGALCFFAFAINGAYRRKHLDELEKRGTVKPEIAARIRNMKYPWLPVWLGFIAGVGFLVKAFVPF